MAIFASARRSAPGVFAIDKFVEKPDAKTAERYVAEGYLWNSGNFMFRAGSLLDEFRGFEPTSAAAVTAAVAGAGDDLGFITLDAEAFARATAKSIDYAVMERTTRAAVIPVSYGWSDVGSWNAVWELSERDAAGNAARGPAAFVDSRGSYAASDKQLVALYGVDDLIVVATDDAVLVARRDDGDGLRRLVKRVKEVAPEGDRGTFESSPAVGLVPVGRSGQSLPGQAYRGQTGRTAVAAIASSPRRALGHCPRHCESDDRK